MYKEFLLSLTDASGNTTELYMIDGVLRNDSSFNENGTLVTPGTLTTAEYALSDAFKCEPTGPEMCSFGLQFDNQVQYRIRC